MDAEFAALPDIAVPPGVAYSEPPLIDTGIDPGSPALAVMTDFTVVQPRCTAPGLVINAALEAMRTAGVRLLLVADYEGAVLGIITAYDILGEAPVRIAAQTGETRARIRVEQVMTPAAEVRALDFAAVEMALVGNIIETLRQLEQSHLLVVESSERLTARGLFSAAEVARRLRVDIGAVESPARSFAHLSRELA